jgi:hypothetical protein
MRATIIQWREEAASWSVFNCLPAEKIGKLAFQRSGVHVGRLQHLNTRSAAGGGFFQAR